MIAWLKRTWGRRRGWVVPPPGVLPPPPVPGRPLTEADVLVDRLRVVIREEVGNLLAARQLAHVGKCSCGREVAEVVLEKLAWDIARRDRRREVVDRGALL